MHAGDGSEIELTGEVETVALEPTPNVMQDGVPTFRVTMGVDSLGGWAVQSGMVVDYHITTRVVRGLPDGTHARHCRDRGGSGGVRAPA